MMVLFGLPYEVIILTGLAPALFLFWYIRSVMGSRPVKVIYESQDKDLNMDTVYPARWDIKSNSVTVIKSRKERIEVKKATAPKYLHFPPLFTQVWFRVKEGAGETYPWDMQNAKEKKDKHQLGYESKAMISGLVDDIKSKAALSIKGQYMGLLAGGGFGLAGGFILAQLII